MTAETILEKLVEMSRYLGDPANDLAILGEGNTSARIDDETFWVKASGFELRTIDAAGFVRVRFRDVLAALDLPNPTDQDILALLERSKVDAGVTIRPSVETILHALVLQLEGVNFVGHTHPTLVNAILCSQKAEEAVSGRLFPEEIVYCGVAPLFIPYTDPGVALARAVRDGLNRYQDTYYQPPKVILLQNHGLIALGKTAADVQHTTAMYVKTARVILGTYALGGPHFLPASAVERIHTRPDEEYRRALWRQR
jgi:rhamnose utilization protein RhaD (predicted bifunctional aldolase and dehydrogenase)